MEPGVTAVGKYKNVTMNQPFFQGHFPQLPWVMPGGVNFEALAQVWAIAVLSLPENKGKLAFFCRNPKMPNLESR